MQTEFVIEEMPDEVTVTQPYGAADEATPQTALPPAGNQDVGWTSTTGARRYGTAHPTSAYNEVQSMVSQRPAAAGQYADGLQYATIGAGQAGASAGGYKHTMIEVPSMAPNMSGNALVPTNSFLPAATAPGNALVPATSGTQYEVAQVQPQFAAGLPTPTYEWAVSPSSPIGAARPQQQLEATSAQMQQISGIAPQRQLEAPPSSSTGQELVYQSRDLERQIPRR